MKTKHYKNIFACLVHEKPECIVDLVRNLRYFSHDSCIILYNGSNQENLLDSFPFERMGVYVCPLSKPMKWGWLHEFALDCMKYASTFCTFDTFTIVDSDQLCIRKGYIDTMQKFIQENPQVGILTNKPQRELPPNLEDPSVQMYKEKKVWETFLETLPNGKEAFMYWGFWPSTVFMYDACQALVKLFEENTELKEILKTTKIWASEEVLFPTLVKALGFEIAHNPCSYEYVKYRKDYTNQELNTAFQNPKAFWVHPVLRNIRNPMRQLILKESQNYTQAQKLESLSEHWIDTIIHKSTSIEGWLSIQEGLALAKLTKQICDKKESPVIVEIGVYCGKATCTIGLTLKEFAPKGKVYAIDSFKGLVGAADHIIEQKPPTYQKFLTTINSLELNQQVEVIKANPEQVRWESTIDILLIDGLHDYFNVLRDFYLFENSVVGNGFVVFHDYADYYLGVQALVNEIILSQEYEKVSLTDSLVILKKKNNTKENPVKENTNKTKAKVLEQLPLVSCITPTYNRADLLKISVENFLKQDYPNKELIILDDSETVWKYPSLEKLSNVHYIHQDIKRNIGQKRNIACQYAQGKIIVHWDDDDWYATDWLSKQVSALQESEADITGLNKPHFYSPHLQQAWKYVYPDHEKPWVHGATLAYWKKVWENNKFPEIQIGEDNEFVWRGHKIMAHQYTEDYVGRVHAGNTSPKYTANSRWHSINVKTLKLINL